MRNTTISTINTTSAFERMPSFVEHSARTQTASKYFENEKSLSVWIDRLFIPCAVRYALYLLFIFASNRTAHTHSQNYENGRKKWPISGSVTCVLCQNRKYKLCCGVCETARELPSMMYRGDKRRRTNVLVVSTCFTSFVDRIYSILFLLLLSLVCEAL